MKYSAEKVKEICRYIAEGKTYSDSYKLAGISESIFYEWKSTKPEFLEAIKRAEEQYKEWYNRDLVASAKKSLKELILGWECEEVQTEFEQDPHNPQAPRIKRQRRIVKKYKPDATAIIFALTNKVPDEFKNRQTIEGKMEQEVTNKPDLSAIPDDLLAKVMESLKASK